MRVCVRERVRESVIDGVQGLEDMKDLIRGYEDVCVRVCVCARACVCV